MTLTEFDGKVVVVTGAAGNLGRAVVKAFLNQGATVFGLDYKTGRTTDLISEKDSLGRFFPLDEVDVVKQGEVIRSAEAVHELAGPVDILVNCLGGFVYGESVHQLSSTAWNRMMGVNVSSFLNLTHAFLPDLLEKNEGRVIAIGSNASLKGSAKMGAYSAAKGALLRLVESLAAEVSGTGIRVNCVLPGTIDTPQNRVEMPTADQTKWVPPEDIAEAILFLASLKAEHINGVVLPING